MRHEWGDRDCGFMCGMLSLHDIANILSVVYAYRRETCPSLTLGSQYQIAVTKTLSKTGLGVRKQVKRKPGVQIVNYVRI